jgi:hypothetical protein
MKSMKRQRTPYLILGLLTMALASRLMAWEAIESADDPCASALSERVRQMVSSMKDRGWIGVEFDETEPPTLTRVVAGSPADEAGLEPGDRWIGVSDFEFAGKSREEVMRRLKPIIMPGNEFTLLVERGDHRLALPIRPIAIPRRILAQWIGGHLVEKYADDLLSP